MQGEKYVYNKVIIQNAIKPAIMWGISWIYYKYFCQII